MTRSAVRRRSGADGEMRRREVKRGDTRNVMKRRMADIENTARTETANIGTIRSEDIGIKTTATKMGKGNIGVTRRGSTGIGTRGRIRIGNIAGKRRMERYENCVVIVDTVKPNGNMLCIQTFHCEWILIIIIIIIIIINIIVLLL